MPSAPLAISTQSRKKLKSFSFNGKIGEDQENLADPGAVIFAEQSNPRAAIAPHTDITQHEPPLPKTPAPCIPLSHLIGNTEDAFNCTPPAATPTDHVLWQHGPRSSNGSSSYYSTQRGKKRARSSSPISLQLHGSSQPSATKNSLNLEKLSKTLRTPQNDPTIDLWNRYANGLLKSNKIGDPDANLFPSSPQTPSTTKSKDSALRRTASCGIEWPTSRSKRRQRDSDERGTRAKGIFAATRRDYQRIELQKPSRVGFLVGEIQERLSRQPAEETEDASDSSPLPDRQARPKALSPIPERQLQQAQTVGEGRADHERHPTSEVLSVNSQRAASSSDYGDEELDFDLLEKATQEIESVDKSRVVPPKSSAGQIDDQQKQFQDSPKLIANPSLQATGQSPRRSPKSPSAAGRTQELVSDDEFGVDDEAFSNDLQNLANDLDSQSKDAPVLDTVPNGRLLETLSAPKDQATDDDGFDDYFDVFDDDDDVWQDVDGKETMQILTGVDSKSQKCSDNRTIKRYLVLDVVDSHHANSQGRRRPEKMLSVKDEKTRMLKIILLRQSWYESRCTKGSYVHLIGVFDHTGQCVVDDKDNMIILHPDHLVSATVVADSFTCTRRATLQDRVKATSAAEKSQVYGHILHEVFGHALSANIFSGPDLRNIIDKLLPSYLESLYEINVQPPEATEYLMSKMPEMQAWASVFVSTKPVPDAVIRDRNGATAWMAINKLLAVEEHVWSPMFGLKGNIDATVQVAMTAPGEDSAQTLTVPFELKTGKRDTNEMHRAQTALYTLLLSDRYDIDVTCGILYYLETSKTFRIGSIRNEIRHMIIQRNELACYVHDKLALPPMIRKPHMCKRCYAQTSCFTYHKLAEAGNGETSGLKDVFDDAVSHLKPQHSVFFQKWDELLTKEERDAMKFRRELWTMLSHEREAVGRCFGKVVIEPGSAIEDQQASKINRFQYAFVKHKAPAGFTFTESQLTIGEPIVISDEAGHFALANGFITNVRPTRVMVAVDRRLHDLRRKAQSFDPIFNQSFTGIMEVAGDGTPFVPQASDPQNPVLYRIDKDEFSNGMATARNNIIRIMEKDLFRARELRQLIIEDEAPTFKSVSTAYTLSGPASQLDLNIDQRRAIDKVMSATDYALVLGMPGTGKTTTIAHIIRALVSQNKSVLLTSYTHTAVDNILLKIKDDNIPVLRLGSVGRVHPDVRTFATLGGVPKTSIEELENSYVNSKVVATTCLGINERIFNARIFDYCIVDEASQITLPVCLGPIRMARTFILVGDHFQLPPLVQNKEAQQGGLDVSLFKLLSDAHPEAVVDLEHQYRMAADIMLLSNELIYNGRLKCGTESIARRKLDIPQFESGLSAHHHTPSSISRSATPSSICLDKGGCWMRNTLNAESRCLFLDTDVMGTVARESVCGGSRITNATEATITAQLITVLVRAGVSPRSIGVITFYRSQLALLKQEVKAIAGSAAAAEVEMHTADKFQGRDKEVVVLSCVRSNHDRNVGELLKDWRRVNVAVTRAKSKLILIGSRATLRGSGNETLEGLVRIFDRKGWITTLPDSALRDHAFQCSSQATGRVGGGSSVCRKSTPTISGPSPATISSGMAQGYRKPAKLVQGGVDVDRLLDRRPILRDIVNESLGQTESLGA